MEQKQYDKALEEKRRVEQSLLNSIKDTGIAYERVLNASEEKKKQTLQNFFFQSLYAAEGIFDNKEKQKMLQMYIPMLILAEEDGAYFFYLQEAEDRAVKELGHIWSDKVFYHDSNGRTESGKKSEVATLLEKVASEIITNHNYIASQYGIDYSFYVPEFLQNTASSLEFPMIFAVVQGWPLLASGKLTYNNCIDAGAYIQKTQKVTVTGPENLERTESRYHLTSCGLLQDKNRKICEENISIKEAIQKYGAIPCEVCSSGK